MKIYLDDIRTPSYGSRGDDWYEWVVVRTVANFTALIQTNIVKEVSVDYSLNETDARHTGEDALLQLLQYCLENPEYRPPYIYIHSSHHDGCQKLQAVTDKIKALPR